MDADPGFLYRTLRKLEEEGAVRSSWDTGGSGPARRVYALADLGGERLHTWAAHLRGTRARLDRFLTDYTTLRQEKGGKNDHHHAHARARAFSHAECCGEPMPHPMSGCCEPTPGHHHGSSCCATDVGIGFRRRLVSGEDKIAKLEAYLADLPAETKAVQDKLTALRKAE